MPQPRIISAQRQRNGIAGRPFNVALVEHAWASSERGPFLVISLDNNKNPEQPSPQETFVVSVPEIIEGHLVSKFRGDNIPLGLLQDIRATIEAQLMALEAPSV